MDEVFGTADFSKVEDVGFAAKRVEEEGAEKIENNPVANAKV